MNTEKNCYECPVTEVVKVSIEKILCDSNTRLNYYFYGSAGEDIEEGQIIDGGSF